MCTDLAISQGELGGKGGEMMCRCTDLPFSGGWSWSQLVGVLWLTVLRGCSHTLTTVRPGGGGEGEIEEEEEEEGETDEGEEEEGEGEEGEEEVVI